jgi:uncharacterized protein YcbX
VSATLTAINRFPVKSCRGEALRSATVEPWGLAGDRRWMVVDADNAVVTAREHPRLVLTVPVITAEGLHLTHPDLDPLDVMVPPESSRQPVQVWKSVVTASVADDGASAWFGKIVGEPVRLVHLGDPTQRATNPEFSRQTDRVSFADGYPLLLTTEESLAAVNEFIADGPLSGEGPLPMARFRPSIVVEGAGPAWVEDGWRRVRIGAAEFRAVKGCDRCVLTTVDPATAARGNEPIASLARHRKWDGKTWFGMSLVPDNPGAVISVGDPVEILEAVDATDGPPRPASAG